MFAQSKLSQQTGEIWAETLKNHDVIQEGEDGQLDFTVSALLDSKYAEASVMGLKNCSWKESEEGKRPSYQEIGEVTE